MKNCILQLLFIFLQILVSCNIYSQQPIDFTFHYGADPLLYNGRLYRLYQPVSTKGTSFLYEKFYYGDVTLRGKVYTDMLINFDILNRHLVLQYTSESGGINRIIVSDAWLESFSMNGSTFEPVFIGDSIPVLCKVLKNDNLMLAYELRKEIIMDSNIGATNMQFSKPIKTSFLISKNKLHRYTSNKTFISFFNESYHQELKKFLRKNKINVKKSGDQEMMNLLNYCSTLL